MTSDFSAYRQIHTGIAEVGRFGGIADTWLLKATLRSTTAHEALAALRAASPQTGRWPVLVSVGDHQVDELLNTFEDMFGNEPNPVEAGENFLRSTLAHAEAMPYERWVAFERDPKAQVAKLEENVRLLTGHAGTEQLIEIYKRRAEEIRNAEPVEGTIEWPEELPEPIGELQSLIPYDDEIGDFSTAALLPTSEGWKAAAYLAFGGFNGCPAASVHVALAKWAWENHGANVASMFDGTVEFVDARRPQSREQAERLARLLATGAETVCDTYDLSEIAATLLAGSAWKLWWD